MFDCGYVSVKVNDWITCGSNSESCRSLSFAIDNISRHNHKTYVIGSHTNQVQNVQDRKHNFH